jgi:pSer/pThr/pTyr-binding forkhead associated (FHA) protein
LRKTTINKTKSKSSEGRQTSLNTKVAAELWLNIGGRDYRLVGRTIRIGRALDNDIVLEHISVSRYHAMISIANSKMLFEDLKSRNGVRVNGKKAKRAELKDNDEIRIGDLAGVYFQKHGKHGY